MTDKERRIQLDAAYENLEKLRTEIIDLYHKTVQVKKNLEELVDDINEKTGKIYKIQEQIRQCKY